MHQFLQSLRSLTLQGLKVVLGGRLDDTNQEVGQTVKDQRGHCYYPTHSFIIRVKSPKNMTLSLKIRIGPTLSPVCFRAKYRVI